MSDAVISFRKRLFAVVMLALAAPCGCQGSCDDEIVDRAVAFMKAHQSCEVDADCTTVGDYCGALPDGMCGQLPMNREGKLSSEWEEISRELDKCAPLDCTKCGAALDTSCKEGSCYHPY